MATISRVKIKLKYINSLCYLLLRLGRSVVGDQTGLEQCIVGPEAVGAYHRGRIIVLDLIDDLLNDGAAIVKTLNIFSVQMKVGDHHLVAAVKHVEQLHLR